MNSKIPWTIATVLTVTIVAIAYMYGESADGELQARILGYFEQMLTFLIGAGAGSVAAGVASYRWGFRNGEKSVQDTQNLQH